MSANKSDSDDSFVHYCKENSITKIGQDKVLLSKFKSAKAKVKEHYNEIEISMFPYSDSLEFYFVDGQKNIAKDLYNGKYKIVAAIDLHNHTQSFALNKLASFIENGHTRGNTCLKIIHGKGLNSQGKNGVLKHLVRRYLERQSQVLAFSGANNSQGGDGVTLVKLKN